VPYPALMGVLQVAAAAKLMLLLLLIVGLLGIASWMLGRLWLGAVFTLSLILFLGVLISLVAPSVFSLPLQMPSGPGPTPNVQFTIIAHDYYFTLQGSANNTIVVRAGDVVRIIFINEGSTAHSFMVAKEPRTGAELAIQGAQIGSAAQALAPGARGDVVFRATTPGRYYYICPVPGHAELGMYALFIVT
jgi:plastocyanin